MDQQRRLEELLSEWDNGRTRGRKLSPEELCESLPELLPLLRGRIEEVRQLERLAQRLDPSSELGGAPLGAALGESPHRGSSVSSFAESGIVEGLLGDFRVLREVGKGGMGVV